MKKPDTARLAAPAVVSAAIAGEQGAAERLIAAIWAKCFRLAASVTGDLSLAQDAAQEACIAVHQKIGTVRDPDAFDAWLYRVLIREAARVRRRNAHTESMAFERGFSSDVTAALDVWRALAGLPPPLRDVTVLFYIEDLKTEDIARVLGVRHATVRTRLNRARERLRVTLRGYETDLLPGQQVKHHAF